MTTVSIFPTERHTDYIIYPPMELEVAHEGCYTITSVTKSGAHLKIDATNYEKQLVQFQAKLQRLATVKAPGYLVHPFVSTSRFQGKTFKDLWLQIGTEDLANIDYVPTYAKKGVTATLVVSGIRVPKFENEDQVALPITSTKCFSVKVLEPVAACVEYLDL